MQVRFLLNLDGIRCNKENLLELIHRVLRLLVKDGASKGHQSVPLVMIFVIHMIYVYKYIKV